MMRRVTTIAETRAALAGLRRGGRTVGLVPTMGALHDGHLSLVRASRDRCDVTVVSVFVNPTQFGPGEDLDSYPRDLDADAALLESAGADLLFAPDASEMYAEGAETRVEPGSISTVLCGASRPGHFAGVATVVVKLLGITLPDFAFFGEKDYQQLKVIERVVRDLDMPVRVMGCPIVRDEDGLALSSRNRYLNAGERVSARVLSRALRRLCERIARGEVAVSGLTRALADEVSGEPEVRLEYAAIVDAETLAPLGRLTSPGRALVAARVGRTRLIDNVAVGPVPAKADAAVVPLSWRSPA